MAELKIITMEDIPVTEVKWLWYPYIPCGKLTIIHGDPGDGKTMMILQLAAILSRGDKLPCDDTEREPIKIIYQTAEDRLSDTIKPRLLAGNAEYSQIKVIDESEAALSTPVFFEPVSTDSSAPAKVPTEHVRSERRRWLWAG